MALIKDYMPSFFKAHRDRFAPHDWPNPGCEEWDLMQRMWFMAFLDRKVTKVEAETASIRLGMTPPRFRNDHLPAVLAQVDAIRAANKVILDVPEDRAQAEREARDCEHCSGEGLVMVYRHDYAGDPLIEAQDMRGEVTKILARRAAHCSCAMGRWMRANTKDVGVLAGTPRLTELSNLWTQRNPTTPELPKPCYEGMSFAEFWKVIERRNGIIQVDEKMRGKTPNIREAYRHVQEPLKAVPTEDESVPF